MLLLGAVDSLASGIYGKLREDIKFFFNVLMRPSKLSKLRDIKIPNQSNPGILYPFLLMAVLVTFLTPAAAGIYKCKSKKGGAVYSDTPCDLSGGELVTVIPTPAASGISSASSPSSGVSSVAQQLDNAVRRSILNNDVDHAESLAVTPKHWEWIAAARANRQARHARGRTEADLSAEKGESWACHIATREYNFEASSYKQIQNSIDAKRSMMHAACGVKEPTKIEIDNRAIIYQRFR